MIVQVCFTLKGNLSIDVIREKLQALKNTMECQYGTTYEIHSCHLNRDCCRDCCINTDVPDLFDDIFGNRYVCEITEYTLDDAIKNIKEKRENLSKKADKLVILSETDFSNVALELELFTEHRVMII